MIKAFGPDKICLQVTQSTDFTELTNKEPWLSSTKLVVKPDMLFGKRGKSGLVALNLDIAQVAGFVKERIGVEVTASNFFSLLLVMLSLPSYLKLPSRLRWAVAKHR